MIHRLQSYFLCMIVKLSRAIIIPGIFFFMLLLTNTSFTQDSSLAHIKWYKYSQNPVIDRGLQSDWDDWSVREPTVIFDGTTYHCWYTGYSNDQKEVIGYAKSSDGITWIKHPDPVMVASPSGNFDDGRVLNPSVIKVGDTLKMWYQGGSGDFQIWTDENSIGYATSLDGITWNKYSGNPVLSPGLPGNWNSYCVLAPTVLYDGITYHMWFAGSDNYKPTEIGYATSTDGITWTEYSGNPVLHCDYNWDWYMCHPYVLFDGVTFHMWWWSVQQTHRERNGYANSLDGINWTKEDSVERIIEHSGGKWGETGISIGTVLFNQEDSTYRLWYSGDVPTYSFAIGFATTDSLLDITSLVKDVDVNKTYAEAGNDTVFITAKVENPSGISLIAKIEAPDHIVIDSLQLYDDGNHNDGNVSDSLYANTWSINSTEERLHYLDLYVKRINTDTVMQKMNNTKLFTTIGPVVLEDFAFHSSDTIPNPDDKLLCKLTLKNNGSIAVAKNIRAVITCSDSLVTISTNFSSFNDIAAGTEITSNIWYVINISNNCGDSTEIPFRVDIYSDGYIFWSDTFSIEVVEDPTNNEESIELPKEFLLEPNYPNPFNPSTVISYQLPVTSEVMLKVYDVLGREVATLVNEQQKAGTYNVQFTSSNGQLTSGVYFYQMKAGSFVETKKMVLLR